MAIINRNYLINKIKKLRNKNAGGVKRKGKAKIYYNISCPKCGDPKIMSHYSINRFGSPRIGKTTKCVLCNTLLRIRLSP